MVNKHLGFEVTKNSGLRCTMPYKITTNGEIHSCDRIPQNVNPKITGILDECLGYDAMMEKHYCFGKSIELCETCEISDYCMPCFVYADNTYNNSLVNGEYTYCVMMKIIHAKAVELFENKKADFAFNATFSKKLRDHISSGNYKIT
jgi:hypothetical protein